MSRRWGYVVAWVVAATLAVIVGIAAISQVGASIRGRGPLGTEAPDPGRGVVSVKPDRDSPEQRKAIAGDWGEFVVGCRGVAAYGRDVTAAPGWRIVSYERGPDDDVDAVFANARQRSSVELEVYCNLGVPTLDGQPERNTIPEDEDD